MKIVKLIGKPGSGKSTAIAAINRSLTADGLRVLLAQGNSTAAGIATYLAKSRFDAILLDEIESKGQQDAILSTVEALAPDCTVYLTSCDEGPVNEVKALDVQPGNFVVLRTDPRATPAEINPLVETVRNNIPAGCTIAVLLGDADISALTDESMRKHGWVRDARLSDDQLNALIKDYYSLPDNSVGGSLHIVLDDGNYKRESVEWCLNHAREYNDISGVILAEHLLKLTDEERRVLLKVDLIDDAGEGGAE